MATYKKSPKKSPKKAPNDVLIYGDFNCNTGFGNVIKELVDNFVEIDKKTNFTIFSLNDYAEKSYKYAENVFVIPAKKAPFFNEDDFFQRAALIALIEKFDFNVIFMLNDIEIVGSISGDLQLMNYERKKRKRLCFKTVFYFPVDSPIRPENYIFLKTIDEIATFTDYGHNLIANFYPDLEKKLQIIPHGVNTKNFYKKELSEINDLKEKLFGPGKFVFGTVNRNSSRKDISNILLGFKKFKDSLVNLSGSENIILYLHCNPEDYAGINLRYICLLLNLKENKDVFFPDLKRFNENKGYETEELNDIYNAIDVFVTTTTAEGWGLTVTEAMSTETLTIVPMHTSLKEITDYGQNCLALTRLHESFLFNDGLKVRYKSTPTEIAQRMHHAYTIDFESENIITSNALDKMKNYSWVDSSKKLYDLIKKHLK